LKGGGLNIIINTNVSRWVFLSSGAPFLVLFLGGCGADGAPAPTVLGQLIAQPQRSLTPPSSSSLPVTASAGDAATLNDPTTLATLFAPTNFNQRGDG
jgi:hypothetical protein